MGSFILRRGGTYPVCDTPSKPKYIETFEPVHKVTCDPQTIYTYLPLEESRLYTSQFQM